MNDLVKRKTQQLIQFTDNIIDNLKIAEILAGSTAIPVAYRGKPNDILVAAQMGADVGLTPLQALQNIAIINGHPTLWGDAVIGVVEDSGLSVYINEKFDENSMTATCITQRVGKPSETIRTFSKEDAIQAGLWDTRPKIINRWNKEIRNPSPWYCYPKRMLQMRARGFCLRDTYPDALKGLKIREEVEDYPEMKEVNAAPTQSAKASRVSKFIQDADIVDETIIDPIIQTNQKTGIINIKDLFKEIESSQSVQELSGLAVKLAKASDEDKSKLRKAYSAKNQQLQENNNA